MAILAEMKGATPIDAIDIDNWCYLNSIENVERNNCKSITVYEGEASLLQGKSYDLIIANQFEMQGNGMIENSYEKNVDVYSVIKKIVDII